jgi:hypothetical protein
MMTDKTRAATIALLECGAAVTIEFPLVKHAAPEDGGFSYEDGFGMLVREEAVFRAMALEEQERRLYEERCFSSAADALAWLESKVAI